MPVTVRYIIIMYIVIIVITTQYNASIGFLDFDYHAVNKWNNAFSSLEGRDLFFKAN